MVSSVDLLQRQLKRRDSQVQQFQMSEREAREHVDKLLSRQDKLQRQVGLVSSEKQQELAEMQQQLYYTQQQRDRSDAELRQLQQLQQQRKQAHTHEHNALVELRKERDIARQQLSSLRLALAKAFPQVRRLQYNLYIPQPPPHSLRLQDVSSFHLLSKPQIHR